MVLENSLSRDAQAIKVRTYLRSEDSAVRPGAWVPPAWLLKSKTRIGEARWPAFTMTRNFLNLSDSTKCVEYEHHDRATSFVGCQNFRGNGQKGHQLSSLALQSRDYDQRPSAVGNQALSAVGDRRGFGCRRCPKSKLHLQIVRLFSQLACDKQTSYFLPCRARCALLEFRQGAPKKQTNKNDAPTYLPFLVFFEIFRFDFRTHFDGVLRLIMQRNGQKRDKKNRWGKTKGKKCFFSTFSAKKFLTWTSPKKFFMVFLNSPC
jgi:hypothetical protein